MSDKIAPSGLKTNVTYGLHFGDSRSSGVDNGPNFKIGRLSIGRTTTLAQCQPPQSRNDKEARSTVRGLYMGNSKSVCVDDGSYLRIGCLSFGRTVLE